MSFPSYPKYKDSGVEWLGEVPDHWALKRIGYYFKERREKVSDKDFPALSVTKHGIVPQLDTAAKSDDGDNRKKVCQGDFVINSRSDRKGSAGASELDGSVSLICTVLHPQEHVHTPFIHHLLRSQPFQEEFYRNGKGIVADLWSTNYSEMRNILLGMPPLAEQTAIAAFLDRETGKIDGLVAEQRRLMELLKEKRQAVISHAVTKGLNPHAPLKPSGIEWLGDVPKHWRTGRLAFLVDLLVDGTHFSPPSWPEGDFKYVTAKNIKEHGFDFSELTYVTPEEHSTIYARCPVRRDDVLYIKDGATAGIAMVNPLDEQFSLLSSVALIRPKPTLLTPEFTAYHLNAGQFKNDVLQKLVGGAMTRFTVDMIRRFLFAIPPLKEQQSITAFLDAETAKFDPLTAEAQRAIDLLQERRTALISAAVTGQIDVRNAPAT